MMDRLKGVAARFWDETMLGNTSDVGGQLAPVAVANEMTSLYGPHSILRYDQCDPDTGLFYSDNSVAFCFEVTAQTGAGGDMASRLNMLFTPVPPHYRIQWCLFGSPVLDDQFRAYMGQRHIAVDNGKTTPFSQELARCRAEHIYKAKGKPLWPNDNYVVESICLLSSIIKAGSFRDAKLVEEMYELREAVRASLCMASLSSLLLDSDGLASFLWPILSPGSMFSKEPFLDPCYNDGRFIKNQVMAFDQHVRVKANELLSDLPSEKQGDGDKRIAVRGFGVFQHLQKKELWEMANIIGSSFDDGLQYPCPFLVCGGVLTPDPNAVDGKVQIKTAHTK